MSFYELDKDGTIVVDDMIQIKDAPLGCGSKILEGFKPLFSAESVERLEKAGYKIKSKAQVGEFSLDLVGEFSNYEKMEGKLKGACAEEVKEKGIDAGLGVDVFGQTRRAAALSGIKFLKPTYGTVSRYGIVSTAASGECLGVYGKTSDKISDVMKVIAGHDDKDGTSIKEEVSYDTNIDVSKFKVCVIKNLLDLCDDDTKKKVSSFTEKLKSKGIEVEEISSDLFEKANAAWTILSSAEVCNNVSRFDGVKYGYRAEKYRNIDELYVKSRTEGLNFLTKSVILYGSDVLSKNRYKDTYEKSLKVRRVIFEEFEKLTKEYDAILLSACSKSSYESYDIKDAFMKVQSEGVFTSLPSLIGAPALVTDGIQLLGGNFTEGKLLSIAKTCGKEDC